MTWDGLVANSFWFDAHRLLFNKDCRSMVELPDEFVQMVVTSPPYWGLRKYAGLPDLIWGGDKDCQHEWGKGLPAHHPGQVQDNKAVTAENAVGQNTSSGNFCSLCGAWKGAFGLEPTPEMYTQHTIEILREIRRVLRKDGCVFLNLGDSYFGGGNNRGNNFPISDKQAGNFGAVGQLAEHQKNIRKHPVLKPKDLCLIPFRVAIAAQEDGWWVRSVIIWSKPNPMPESVRDRPTESHEYILMLAKSARYYWDAEAVRENLAQASIERNQYQWNSKQRTHSPEETRGNDHREAGELFNPSGRNLRSVWTFPTQPYPEAHFATYPEKLVELCVKAATPEVGCCNKCGKPWVRQRADDIGGTKGHSWHPHVDDLLTGNVKQQSGNDFETYQRGETLGWQPTCSCNADKVPSIVLDPFAGSGTTLKVAAELNRRAIGYELSEEYCKLAIERNKQKILL